MTDQQTLRRQLKQLRHSLPAREAASAQAAILRRLRRHPWFVRARRIAAYFGSNGEVDPMPLLTQISDPRRRLYLPVLHPFRHGRWMLAHNGTIFGFDAVRLRWTGAGFEATLLEAMAPDWPAGARVDIGCIQEGALVLSFLVLPPA